MPDPTKRDLPVGQPYGDATEQQAFMAESNVAPQVVAQPPVSPVTPQTAPDLVEPDDSPDDEGDGQNMVSLEDGDVDLNQILFGGTQRPEEAVNFGIPGAPQRRDKRVSEALGNLMRRGFDTPDVEALFDAASRLGV